MLVVDIKGVMLFFWIGDMVGVVVFVFFFVGLLVKICVVFKIDFLVFFNCVLFDLYSYFKKVVINLVFILFVMLLVKFI